jgi:hypothetical protein
MDRCVWLLTVILQPMDKEPQTSAPSAAAEESEANPKAGGQRGETVVMTLGGSSSTEGSADSRGEISAATIARMMGLATVSETKLVESKVDLLATKINLLQVKFEKVISLLGNVATGADLERIDVQVGALRQLIRDVLAGGKIDQRPVEGADAAKKPAAKIQSTS